MKTTFLKVGRTLPLLGLALGLSGFGPGGCGPDPTIPVPPPDPEVLCAGLDESACLADSRCAAEYEAVLCVCDCAAEVTDCPPCPCPKGAFAACRVADPPPACNLITNEAACLARPDCQPLYGSPVPLPCTDKGGCGPVPVSFVSCEPRFCPAVMCDLACPAGLAHDGTGCEVCACAPILCTSDAECPAGELCLYGDTRCPPNARCMAPQGVCGRVDQGCDSDTQCRPGERCVFPAIDCPPDAFCAPPRGTCQPAGCLSDADCAPSEQCQLMDSCMATGCPRPSGMCVPRTTCTSDAQCGPGQYCELTYPRCGNDPTPPTGVCKPIGCPPVACLLYCEYGMKKDAAGCDTCECNPAPTCFSDADCRPDQYCTYFTGACPPGAPCPPPSGVCMPRPTYCSSDAECAAGERCQLCPPNADCAFVGRCVPAGCLSDADCAAGEVCMFPNCPTDANCLGGGVCAARDCASDADCAAGTTCQPDPTDPCNGPYIYCFQAGRSICLPSVTCHGDAECGPDRHCELPLVNCGPLSNCPNPQGTCVDGPRVCTSDADCMGGQVCSAPSLVCPPGTMCPDPIGACVDPQPKPCGSAADCDPGQVCAPDPNACRTTPCYMMAPLPTVCLPPCGGLSESACNYRGDCRAVYGPSACSPDGSICTADWVFKACQ